MASPQPARHRHMPKIGAIVIAIAFIAFGIFCIIGIMTVVKPGSISDPYDALMGYNSPGYYIYSGSVFYVSSAAQLNSSIADATQSASSVSSTIISSTTSILSQCARVITVQPFTSVNTTGSCSNYIVDVYNHGIYTNYPGACPYQVELPENGTYYNYVGSCNPLVDVGVGSNYTKMNNSA